MEIEKLYKFNFPQASLGIPEKLISREYAVYKEAGVYRIIWIASRFCWGLNQMEDKNYRLRLFEEEGWVTFQLKDKEQLLSFRLAEAEQTIEESVSVIKDAFQDKINQYADTRCSLVCFINNPNLAFDAKAAQEIAGRFQGQSSPFEEIWLFVKGLEQTHYLAKIYPQVKPLSPFEVIVVDKTQKIAAWVIIIASVIFVLLALIQTYRAFDDTLFSGWDFWEFLNLYHSK